MGAGCASRWYGILVSVAVPLNPSCEAGKDRGHVSTQYLRYPIPLVQAYGVSREADYA